MWNLCNSVVVVSACQPNRTSNSLTLPDHAPKKRASVSMKKSALHITRRSTLSVRVINVQRMYQMSPDNKKTFDNIDLVAQIPSKLTTNAILRLLKSFKPFTVWKAALAKTAHSITTKGKARRETP